MASKKSSIVSAQYSFPTYEKDGQQQLLENIAEFYELFLNVPNSFTFFITNTTDEILVLQRGYINYKGVGDLAAGFTSIETSKSPYSTTDVKDSCQIQRLAGVTKVDCNFPIILEPNDRLSFGGSISYSTSFEKTVARLLFRRTSLLPIISTVTTL